MTLAATTRNSSSTAGDVYCCYKGCTTAVWSNSEAELIPKCSSATCLGCRRIVFCFPHFSELYRGRSRFTCPQCGEAEWWLNQFGDDTLDFDLQDTEEKRRQLVQNPHDVPAATGHTHGTSERQTVPHEAPALEWRLIGTSLEAAGYRRLGPGLAIKANGDYIEIDTSGAPWRLKVSGEVVGGAISRTGQRVVIGVVEEGKRASQLLCHEFGTRPIRLAAPGRSTVLKPRFFSESRFVYLSRDTEGALTLHEGTFDYNYRIRGRRIRRLGEAPIGPIFLLPQPGQQSVLTLRASPDGYSELISVSLSTCEFKRIHILEHGVRQLAAARYAATIAWITLDGRVWQLLPHAGAAQIGHTDEGLLGISDDGEQIAWLHRGRLEVVHLSAGTAHQYPATEGGRELQWTGRTADL